MIDVERVAPCLPGAEVTEAHEQVYQGTFTVKPGPTTAAYAAAPPGGGQLH
jgi:carbon monoxide dehydrogenase subunit G